MYKLAQTVMAGFDRPWAIAGGWAIDLFLGRVTREHHDLEIVVFRVDQTHLQQHLTGWDFKQVVNGVIHPWPIGEHLSLPIHETYAERGPDKLEILLNESDGDNWLFRRDPRIHRPLTHTLLLTLTGLPYLCPEIALLYKSKNPRPKDQQDFNITHPHLTPDQRRWLHDAIKLQQPDHPWLPFL